METFNSNFHLNRNSSLFALHHSIFVSLFSSSEEVESSTSIYSLAQSHNARNISSELLQPGNYELQTYYGTVQYLFALLVCGIEDVYSQCTASKSHFSWLFLLI